MNIYFACSITGGRDLEPVYQTLVRALLEAGHIVPTAHLAETTVKAYEASIQPEEVYTRDTTWIQACDTLVAEVSTPSHGVGYEIAFALSLGKPVLCLHHEGVAVSKMITGNSDPRLRVQAYRDAEEAVSRMKKYLSQIQSTL